MSKNRLIKQENGSIAIYAVATILSFILILGGVFFTSSVVRKSQLRTLLKIKEIYAQEPDELDEIAENIKRMDTSAYVKDGLVVFYDAINNTGTSHSNDTKVWKDLSGNGNDITLYNFDSTDNSGWGDNVLNFDGTNDYCNRKNPLYNSAALPENFTVEVISAKNSNTAFGSVLSFDHTVNKRDTFGLWTAGQDNRSYEINYFYDIDNNVNLTAYSCSIPYDNYPINTFKLLSFGKNGNLGFTYMNANKQDERNIPSISNWASDELYLGRPESDNYYFNGKIQSVRIYNRVLTDAEILQNYKVDKERYGIIQDQYEFAYTGAVQEWTVPVTGKYKLEVWGAQGGMHIDNKSSASGTGIPGKGGYSTGNIQLEKGAKLNIYVGGAGSNKTDGQGGFNGGGNSKKSTNNGWNGGSGGGASDIRINEDSLYARVIVAGGGGGLCHWNLANAGNGGGLQGTTPSIYKDSNVGATSGTQISGGSLGYYSSAESKAPYTQSGFGIAGNFDQSISGNYEGAGGGGGWYGGGSGCYVSGGRRLRLGIH